MTVHPISNGTTGGAAPERVGGASGQQFDQLLKQFLSDARHIEQAADQAVAQFAAGDASSVHGVMLAVAQAEMAVRLVMEVRDRLIQAYNELQRIQV